MLSLFCVVEGSENNSKILIQLSSCPRRGIFENMTVIKIQKHLEERNLVNANKLVFAHVAATKFNVGGLRTIRTSVLVKICQRM